MLKPGDKLKVKRVLINPVGFVFNPGDIFTLIEPTGMAPHGYKSPICNWLVDAPNGVTVWSSIWLLIEYGHLERIPNEQEEGSKRG